MPTTKRPEQGEDEAQSAVKGGTSIQDRIAAFAMLDGMDGKTQAEKSMRLRLVGFSNAEIAEMLQTTPAVVATNLYLERKKLAKKAEPRKGAASPENGG
jgi:DNA-directed RNA polymerase specialized sigma24 family protein